MFQLSSKENLKNKRHAKNSQLIIMKSKVTRDLNGAIRCKATEFAVLKFSKTDNSPVALWKPPKSFIIKELHKRSYMLTCTFDQVKLMVV